MDQQRLANELEKLLDDSNFIELLSILEAICREKEEHLLVNWQDKEMAKVWRQRADALAKFSTKMAVKHGNLNF